MKASVNVETCLLILPVYIFCQQMFLNLPVSCPALFRPIQCAVTLYPVSHITVDVELQHVIGTYSTWIGSYRTLDGDLKHTGWVQINAGNIARQNKS